MSQISDPQLGLPSKPSEDSEASRPNPHDLIVSGPQLLKLNICSLTEKVVGMVLKVEYLWKLAQKQIKRKKRFQRKGGDAIIHVACFETND